MPRGYACDPDGHVWERERKRERERQRERERERGGIVGIREINAE